MIPATKPISDHHCGWCGQSFTEYHIDWVHNARVCPACYRDFMEFQTEQTLTPEQPTASIHLCAYCNNPVPNGKFVHQSCEDRHDEREEQADRECGYSAE